jgi:hypothetical protein
VVNPVLSLVRQVRISTFVRRYRPIALSNGMDLRPCGVINKCSGRDSAPARAVKQASPVARSCVGSASPAVARARFPSEPVRPVWCLQPLTLVIRASTVFDTIDFDTFLSRVSLYLLSINQSLTDQEWFGMDLA